MIMSKMSRLHQEACETAREIEQSYLDGLITEEEAQSMINDLVREVREVANVHIPPPPPDTVRIHAALTPQ